MLRKKEAATAVFTLVCAMSIGFVMQNSEDAKLRYGTESPEPPSVTAIDAEDIVIESSLLDVKDVTLTSASFEVVPGVLQSGSKSVLDQVVLTNAQPQLEEIDVKKKGAKLTP